MYHMFFSPRLFVVRNSCIVMDGLSFFANSNACFLFLQVSASFLFVSSDGGGLFARASRIFAFVSSVAFFPFLAKLILLIVSGLYVLPFRIEDMIASFSGFLLAMPIFFRCSSVNGPEC